MQFIDNVTSVTQPALSVGGLLSAIASPIVLFHATGEIQYANTAFHHLIATHDWVWVADRRLKSRSPSITEFDRHVREIVSDRTRGVSMVLQGSDRRRALLIGFSVVPGNEIVVCNFIDPFKIRSPKTSALKHLFGLTENESQVTAMIAVGLDYKEIAASRRLSIETVRSYTKAIFKKLGVSSRAGVVSTVQSATLPLELLFASPCSNSLVE